MWFPFKPEDASQALRFTVEASAAAASSLVTSAAAAHAQLQRVT
jgi:hypothetical protein